MTPRVLYNYQMRFQRFLVWLILLVFGLGAFYRPGAVRADEIQPAPVAQVSAYELILAMNTLRVSSGLPALIEDPIVNAVAQSTAQIMAANNMSWHIGDVRGRLAGAGYGAGGTVWATENFAVGSGGTGIDSIMATWADPDHMRPAVDCGLLPCGRGCGAGLQWTLLLHPAGCLRLRAGMRQFVTSSSGGTSQPGDRSESGLAVDRAGQDRHTGRQTGRSIMSSRRVNPSGRSPSPTGSPSTTWRPGTTRPGIHPCKTGRNYSSRARTRKATPRQLPMA